MKFCVGDFSLDSTAEQGRQDEVDHSQTEILFEDNVVQCRRQATYSKYPKQALKVICTSSVKLIALMFEFHISEKKKKKKTFMAVFIHEIPYLNIMKTFCF